MGTWFVSRRIVVSYRELLLWRNRAGEHEGQVFAFYAWCRLSCQEILREEVSTGRYNLVARWRD